MHPAHSHLFTEAFSYKHTVTSLKKIDQMAPALIASCAGYPKVAVLWTMDVLHLSIIICANYFTVLCCAI